MSEHNLKTKTTPPKQTQFNYSITGVNPVRTHGFGVFNGKRKVWSVRVDETLLKQAKPVLKAKFGSECRGVETWLAGLVATTKGEQLAGVYPSNTVEIGKLVIERNIRSRRKLVVEEEVTERTIEILQCDFCGKPLVVAEFQHKNTGMIKKACDYHAKDLRVRKDWLEVTV